MAYSIDYINLICTDLGTTAGHRYEIDGINAICVALGGVGGHRYTIDGLNEICSLQSVATGHKYNIDALNAIATGAFRYEDEAWGYIQVGTVLNQIDETLLTDNIFLTTEEGFLIVAQDDIESFIISQD